jgi:glycosyltransferase involved in cell wall biosynthesis
MRPIGIPAYIKESLKLKESSAEKIDAIRTAYSKLSKGQLPEVSIVIPAYNEEKNILQTLYSLCNNFSSKPVEIIVVNNNSSDNTEGLVLSTGVRCVREMKQGITAARNAGLAQANGKYILNADADTIYPVDWVEEMIKPLDHKKNVAVVYGRFSFIPIGKTGRLTYFFYEYIADWIRWINKHSKDEAVNVYGFNSGFKREEGLQVEGFDHPPGTNEDGWLALKLREKGFGELFCVTSIKALVWTTDRRIQLDGGFGKAVWNRLMQFIFRKQGADRADL